MVLCITTNLPWPLSPHRLRADLNLAEVSLVNDFEALAYATEDMEAAQLLHLTGPAKAQDGPRLLLGPGTGLGAALWIPNNGRPIVLPTKPVKQHCRVQLNLKCSWYDTC